MKEVLPNKRLVSSEKQAQVKTCDIRLKIERHPRIFIFIKETDQKTVETLVECKINKR